MCYETFGPPQMFLDFSKFKPKFYMAITLKFACTACKGREWHKFIYHSPAALGKGILLACHNPLTVSI